MFYTPPVSVELFISSSSWNKTKICSWIRHAPTTTFLKSLFSAFITAGMLKLRRIFRQDSNISIKRDWMFFIPHINTRLKNELKKRINFQHRIGFQNSRINIVGWEVPLGWNSSYSSNTSVTDYEKKNIEREWGSRETHSSMVTGADSQIVVRGENILATFPRKKNKKKTGQWKVSAK